MKIVIPKEISPGETRVAVIPSIVSKFIRDNHEVFVETGAGISASHADRDYQSAGAQIVSDVKQAFRTADVLLKVQPPKKEEAEIMREGSTYIGFLAPLANRATIQQFQLRKITSFSLEFVPRISRAQSMDALSSMATVGGYKAVLLATEKMGKMFPLLMTAAGTIPPATVLVLGAGVAGLQAIATAKRLGARVEAFDPRPAVKEQVKSLGATFVEMEMPKDVETTGGYAKEMSAEFLKKEMEAISARLPKIDVLISTAQVFGKRAPVLVSADMVKLMRPGTVIVDLAAEQGGNCELTVAGQSVERHGVTIIGTLNLPALLPVDASLMYSKNLLNLFQHIYPKQEPNKAAPAPDFSDEIIKGACITRDGEVVNEGVRAALMQGGQS